MTLFLFLFEWSHKSHFWNLFLKFLKTKNLFLIVLTLKGPSFGKKFKNFHKSFFFKKSYLFFLNLHCTCSKHFFEVYNSYVSNNFEFWPIFVHKISIFATVLQQPAWPKLYFIKCCFLCLWTAKDRKNWMEINFGL